MSFSRRELFRKTGVAAAVMAAVATIAADEKVVADEVKVYEPSPAGASGSVIWEMPTGYIVGKYHPDGKACYCIYDGGAWIDLDTRVLCKEKYSKLYSVIGDTYGKAPAGKFRLPNYQGKENKSVGYRHF